MDYLRLFVLDYLRLFLDDLLWIFCGSFENSAWGTTHPPEQISNPELLNSRPCVLTTTLLGGYYSKNGLFGII